MFSCKSTKCSETGVSLISFLSILDSCFFVFWVLHSFTLSIYVLCGFFMFIFSGGFHFSSAIWFLLMFAVLIIAFLVSVFLAFPVFFHAKFLDVFISPDVTHCPLALNVCIFYIHPSCIWLHIPHTMTYRGQSGCINYPHPLTSHLDHLCVSWWRNPNSVLIQTDFHQQWWISLMSKMKAWKQLAFQYPGHRNVPSQ